MQALALPASMHICPAPVDVHAVPGAVQNDPYVVQHAWPAAPHVPQEPLPQTLADIPGQAWPLAVQRLP
jgi:hypothetical protein